MVNGADAALLALLRRLEALRYDFVTVTPATHARVLGNDPVGCGDLRDLLGWSRPLGSEVPADIVDLLERAEVLEESEGKRRSTIRVSRMGGKLFLHSAYPTDAPDSVFFGPDTYRFARFIHEQMRMGPPPATISDMGAGSGAGGIAAALEAPGAALTLVDCNPLALRFAAVNAEAAGVEAEVLNADSLDALDRRQDLIIANPPYMIDAGERAYRDGGALLGTERAVEWALDGAHKLSPGGAVLLYSGSPVVRGEVVLTTALAKRLPSGFTMTAEELDPDVFGEELDQPAYRDVERIAVLGIRVSPAPR